MDNNYDLIGVIIAIISWVLAWIWGWAVGCQHCGGKKK
jgi:hypothetical protein